MHKKPGFWALVQLTCFSLICGVCYEFYYQISLVSEQIEVALHNVDSEVSTIKRELSQIPLPPTCTETYRQRLFEAVYTSVNIRDIAVQKVGDEEICMVRGFRKLALDDSYWHLVKRDNISLALNHSSTYIKNRSFIVVLEDEGFYRAGAVNPELIERLWFNEHFDFQSTALYIDEIVNPVFIDSHTGDDWLDFIIYTHEIHSKTFPLYIRSTVPLRSIFSSTAAHLMFILLVCLFLSFVFSSLKQFVLERE